MTTNVATGDIAAMLTLNRNIPAKQPMKVSFDYKEHLAINEIDHSAVNAIIWAMLVEARVMFGARIVVTGKDNVPCTGVRLVDNSEKKLLLGDPYPAGTKDDIITEDNFVFIRELAIKIPRIILELVGAHQVGSLRDRNVESYFKMAQADISVEKIMKTIHFLSLLLPKIVENPLFQAKIKDTVWLTYHTAAASSQQLVNKFIEETKGLLTITPETKTLVAAALAEPWKIDVINKIPKRAIALTYVYLDATGQLPDKWFQGIKAFNAMATMDKVKFKAVFIKYSALNAQVVTVEGAADIAALKVLVVAEVI